MQTGGEHLQRDAQLTALLARTVMGWKAAPDRFVKSGRSWIPRWRFSPFTRLQDAFLLLDRNVGTYKLERLADGKFAAEVQHSGGVGRAKDRHLARAITYAVARSRDLEGVDG